jgi:hypothetical protein
MHVLIAGLGKSGTTALYYAVRAGMPGGTRCLFEPKSYRPTKARHVLAKILAQRGVDWRSFSGFDRKIAILRDPRDQLVSFVLYALYNHERPVSDRESRGLLALLEAKERNSRAVPLWRISETVEAITGWNHRKVLLERHEICRRHVETDPAFFRLRYDDFILGRTAALEQHLGFTLPHRVDVPGRLRRVERTRGTGDWRHWFTDEDVAYFGPDLAPVLRAFGFEDDWSLADAPVVPPQHASGYVRGLLQAQRRRTRWLSRWLRTLSTLTSPTRQRDSRG